MINVLNTPSIPVILAYVYLAKIRDVLIVQEKKDKLVINVHFGYIKMTFLV